MTASARPPSTPPSGETSPAPRGAASAPERRCIATGEVRPVAELVRFVVSPDGVVVPDIEGTLPGRGIWVTAEAGAVAQAAARGAFARAARSAVSVPEGLDALVRATLARRVLSLLGLAKKAGRLVAGHAKVADAAARPGISVLFLASDAGEEGRRNTVALAARTGAPVIAAFSAQELGLALGRPNVVHAALTAGGPGKPSGAQGDARAGGRLAGLVLNEVRRLRGFLEEVPR